jgi:hypothetical protein
MEKTANGWTVATRAWLVRNYILWIVPGGFMIGLAVYIWSAFWHLSPPERFTLAIVSAASALVILVLRDNLMKSRVKGTLIPINMNSADARLTFKNGGKRAEFFVKCEFTGQVNIPNTLPDVVYDLAWENQTVKMLGLAEGDSAHLILATWRLESTVDSVYGKDVERKMGIAELRAFGKEAPEHRMLWNYDPKAKLPACDIKVTVISDGGKGNLERFFTLEPKSFYGPLQVSEYFPPGKDGRRVRQ